jgi:hypothetical protein
MHSMSTGRPVADSLTEIRVQISNLRTSCESVELLYHQTLILRPCHIKPSRPKKSRHAIGGEIVIQNRDLVKASTECPE